MSEPSPNVASVLERIASACERAGRDPGSVTLVAATKTVAPERIVAVGVADAGENRVQELLAKQDALAGSPIRWHFIGRLQRNKVRKVVGKVELIHSVDSIELCRAIDRVARETGIVQRVLVEVNFGEESKGGIPESGLPALLREAAGLEGLRVEGLMTIPPAGDPEAARAVYRRLAELSREQGLAVLSMGMSGDFEIAIEEGATMVRVGGALFGPRPAAG